MTSGAYVHLIEPSAWRVALGDGAVRPPSLDEVGFVHLSTPEQVHLPAAVLYPGRRDLALLVVDPARLPDPVRLEPGAHGEEQLFPHLYGPLPAAAVVAVVPWRPPTAAVLPDPADALGRALALQLSLPVRRAAEVRDVPGGVAVLDARFPWSHDDNRLLITGPVDADTIAATAVGLATEAGVPDPAATLFFRGAAGVAADLAGRGWDVEERVVMARPATPAGGSDGAEVVDQREVHGLWDRSWRRGLAPRFRDERLLDEVVGQLVGREHRNDDVVDVRDVVVRDGGQVVAAGQLRIDGATAAVDSVLTDPAARGRGYAGAVLARCLDLAVEAGCNLVVLEAVAGDRPRHWYARRGFEVVGSTWQVYAGTRAESSR